MCLASVFYALLVFSMLLCLSTKEDIPFNSKHTHTRTQTHMHTQTHTGPSTLCKHRSVFVLFRLFQQVKLFHCTNWPMSKLMFG